MQNSNDNDAGLTPAGVANSWILGTAVYSAFGPGAYVLVCLYFLLGSAVSAEQACLHQLTWHHASKRGHACIMRKVTAMTRN